jgi:thiamine-monophosphate kinase
MRKRTEISTLGEFGLIRPLTDKTVLKNERATKGMGDAADIEPTSMIDVSDSLSSELLHIRRTHPYRLPDFLHGRTVQHEFSNSRLERKRRLRTLIPSPPSEYEEVSSLKGIHLMGHILLQASLGSYLIGRDGGEVKLIAQGWQQLQG